jgi:pimeloyl-ACP methyl ester carboxylesterase
MKKMKMILLMIAGAALSVLPTLPARAATAQTASLTCQQQRVAVTLSAANATVYHIAGWLCWQGSLQGKTVQFLEHGATYDHNYWDWPLQPGKYSYVQQETSLGFAIFNIDRLGIGQSDHPDSALVTQQSEAFVAHQIIQDLRQGYVHGTVFSKVVSVGHSLGSFIALLEASTHHDVSGLVLTGFMHALNPDLQAPFGAALYPAQQDPKFMSSGLPAGYLTTRPGTRGPLFYNAATADSKVSALDEQLKQTLTSGEAASSAASLDPAVSLAVRAPVLIAVGQQDFFYCNEGAGLSCASSAAIVSRERTFFGRQACLEAAVQPASGHVINLHPNAIATYNAIAAWAYRRVGVGALSPTQPCV